MRGLARIQARNPGPARFVRTRPEPSRPIMHSIGAVARHPYRFINEYRRCHFLESVDSVPTISDSDRCSTKRRSASLGLTEETPLTRREILINVQRLCRSFGRNM